MELVDAAWDLVLGGSCVGCGTPGRPWCRACRRGLAAATAGPPRRAEVVPAPPGLPPVWSAGAYDGALRDAVLAYKERCRRSLAGPLGAALAGPLAVALAEAGVADPTVVGVPASRAGRRERGFDHVALLLRATATRGLPPALPLLRWVRATGDQAQLGSAGRATNLRNALVAAPCAGRTVVLVDDVVTTGATLAEASRALRAAGAAVVGAATVATTVRRSVRPDDVGPTPGVREVSRGCRTDGRRR